MTDREACIVFNMISGVGYIKYRALCNHFGSPSEALKQPEGELLQVPGIGPQLADRITRCREEVDLAGELAFAERSGVRILTLFDDAYPDILRHLYDPPMVLYVRGILPECGINRNLAVVGTRRVSRYGAEVTRRLAEDAARAGLVIISGLALGVDTIAHQAAVDNHAPTVAVLGGGLARLHPQENLELARKIVETGGAVISEFPMRFPVSRTSFPRRNRIVARLADAVLVTEAGVDSGALITADLAAEYNLVMAVPGRIDNPQAAGCHKLLKNGATLVENFNDIQDAMHLGLLPLDFEFSEPEAEYRADGISDFPAPARQILETLAIRACSFDELADATGLEADVLSSNLSLLELAMKITRDPDQTYSLRRLS